GGAGAEEVLWAIWDASGLAAVWEQQAEHDPAADRDLDAVLALFEAAARFGDDLPPGRPQLFLDSLIGQEIAGDTIAEQAVRDDSVRVLTAHRSKGLEWDVVVVAGVQEEIWPDLRLRGPPLGGDRGGRRDSGDRRERDGRAAQRCRRRRAGGPAAGGGTAPVLRRRHPRQATAGGDRVGRRRAGQ